MVATFACRSSQRTNSDTVTISGTHFVNVKHRLMPSFHFLKSWTRAQT